MINKRGLGKGLGALIPEGDEKEGNSVVELKITEVEPNERQPRRDFDEQGLTDLAESIREHGVVQPIIVRKLGSGYQIIAGERRWRASRKAGKKTIPAIIKECSNVEVMEIALIENLQREDLNSIEEAYAYKSLIDEYNMTQEEIAQRIGKSRPAVANSLRLLQLPQEIKDMIAAGRITQGHARALLAIDSSKKQVAIAEKIVNQQLNVRQIEKLAKDSKTEKQKIGDIGQEQLEIKQMEEKLKAALGTKVIIQHKKNKGRIEIEYYSNDELERILEILVK